MYKRQVFGYRGKQVRDNIHSNDLVQAFDSFFSDPRCAAVYNIGGGRDSNCSMLEAIGMCEEISGNSLNWSYSDEHRSGDHQWWVSDVSRFKKDYPAWSLRYKLPDILREIYERNAETWIG